MKIILIIICIPYQSRPSSRRLWLVPRLAVSAWICDLQPGWDPTFIDSAALIYLIFVNSSLFFKSHNGIEIFMMIFFKYVMISQISLDVWSDAGLISWLAMLALFYQDQGGAPPRPPLMNDCFLAPGKFWYLKRWVETVLTAKTHYNSTCGFSNLIKAKSMMSWMFLSECQPRLHQTKAPGNDRSHW